MCERGGGRSFDAVCAEGVEADCGLVKDDDVGVLEERLDERDDVPVAFAERVVGGRAEAVGEVLEPVAKAMCLDGTRRARLPTPLVARGPGCRGWCRGRAGVVGGA